MKVDGKILSYFTFEKIQIDGIQFRHFFEWTRTLSAIVGFDCDDFAVRGRGGRLALCVLRAFRPPFLLVVRKFLNRQLIYVI